MTKIQQRWNTLKYTKETLSRDTIRACKEQFPNVEFEDADYLSVRYTIGPATYNIYCWSNELHTSGSNKCKIDESLSDEEIVALVRNHREQPELAEEVAKWCRKNILLQLVQSIED